MPLLSSLLTRKQVISVLYIRSILFLSQIRHYIQMYNDGQHNLRLAEIFLTSPFQPLLGFQRNLKVSKYSMTSGKSGSEVVKLLACGAISQGFDSPSRRYDVRDWLSPAFQITIWLKDR